MKLTKAKYYTIAFSTAGLLTMLLITYVERNIISTHERNLPYLTVGDQVKNKITRSHLWLEELLSGDNSINFDVQVLDPLTSSQAKLQAAYDGQNGFVKSDNEETRALLKQSVIKVERLASLAEQLKEERSAGNTGLSGDTDAKFDEAFAEAETVLNKFISHISDDVKSDSGKLVSLSWISILVLSVVFSILGVLLYRTQRNNDQRIAENAVRLQEETKRVKRLSQFIEAVSSGNYDIGLEASDENDNLTTMVVNMRNTLKQNAENDNKRNWTTSGLAQIGEILRATTSNSSDLYDNIIRFVVKYTKSNQGGLFILNEDNDREKFLELVSCYAFERKKYLNRQVAIGEGLIGQCFLEGERIYLTEVPQEYVSITSGLGGSNPNSVLLVPLKVNDRIFGVIEIASFKRFEDYEIGLVEKLAESIASTIASVRVNDTTRILLEKTQQQAEEMKSQEEEIRQNMEELEATQEEMRRKQTILEKELEQSQTQSEALRSQEKKLKESQDTLQAIVDNIPRAIFWKDRELRFMGCNKIFASIAGAGSPDDLLGKTDFDMAWSAQAEAYRTDDKEVMKSRASKLDIEEVNINSEGKKSWVRTSKVPIISQTGEVVAILGMFEDITALKLREADVSKKLEERQQLLSELEALKQLIGIRKV